MREVWLAWPRHQKNRYGFMTHEDLGVTSGLLLELLGALGLLHAASSGGEESAADLGGHCVGGVEHDRGGGGVLRSGYLRLSEALC